MATIFNSNTEPVVYFSSIYERLKLDRRTKEFDFFCSFSGEALTKLGWLIRPQYNEALPRLNCSITKAGNYKLYSGILYTYKYIGTKTQEEAYKANVYTQDYRVEHPEEFKRNIEYYQNKDLCIDRTGDIEV